MNPVLSGLAESPRRRQQPQASLDENVIKRTCLMKGSLTGLIVLLMVLGFVSGARAETVSIVKISSDVVIEENTKVRNVVVFGGQITVHGTVEQHVVAIGGSAILTRTAVVGGDVVALGGIIAVGNGADVRGTVTEINSSNISDAISDLLSDDWEGWSWLFAIFSGVVFLITLIIAMPIAALIPKPIVTVSEGIALHTYRAIIAGFIGLLMITPVAVLLTLSVIGIFLIPLEMMLVSCAAIFGFIAVARTLGKRVLALAKNPNDSLVRQTFWGLLVLWIIGWIPYVGWMIKVLAIVLGLGGVIITRFGTKKA
jgi:hypothetical protein